MNVNQQRALYSEKLESISHLSSALVHEIRNPMTVAKGFMQLITSDDVNEEKKKEYTKIAISEIDRAENIIGDFLTYSKPKHDKVADICMAEEIQKVVTILQPLANLNGVQIHFNCYSYSFIRGDASLVEQCLLNLCKNAIEAMENGGTLSIEISQDRNHLYVEIKDTGVGMSEEQIRQLGKPFFSTKGEKGTGLGLMLTYSILKNMNGSIQVTSQLGVGTTFSFSFPLVRT